MKLSRLIREVCRLGVAEHAFFHAYMKKTYPDREFGLLYADELADIPPAPATQELRELLRAQSPALVCMLLTVMRLGRGDFDPGCDFLEEYAESGDNCKGVSDMIDYLMSKNLPLLLERALELLAQVGTDVDDLLDL